MKAKSKEFRGVKQPAARTGGASPSSVQRVVSHDEPPEGFGCDEINMAMEAAAVEGRFLSWCRVKMQQGTTVTLQPNVEDGQYIVEIYECDKLVGKGNTLVDAMRQVANS